ncbi:FAD-dependent oxidoreductase, partial [Actinomadura kijaniata]
MDAIVIGGGIGGLAAALALHRGGHRVRVLERAPAFTEVGAGLALQPNALRALDALGLGDTVRARAAAGPP